MQEKRGICPHCKRVIQKPESRYPLNKDCYTPDVTLVSYLTELASEEKDLDKTLSEEEWTKQKKKIQDSRKNKKYIILNKYIFPSMANLTAFFVLVATNPRLRGIFDEDIQALFFGESQNGRGHNPVFERFIEAVIAVDQNTPPEDFRLVLIEILQRKIWSLFLGMGQYKLKDDLLFHNVLVPDVGRAVSWTSFFAAKARGNISFDKDRRPVLF